MRFLRHARNGTSEQQHGLIEDDDVDTNGLIHLESIPSQGQRYTRGKG